MDRLFRLYLDESGDHTYYAVYTAPKRYLGITGVLFRRDQYATLARQLEDLKAKHFDYDPDNPFVFHRKTMVNKSWPFSKLKDPSVELAFNTDFLQLIRSALFWIITVVIDKKTHYERYGDAAWHPYHYCLRVLLERYAGLLNYWNARGDLMAESRGRSEDQELKTAYTEIYELGTWYRSESFFQRGLTSSEIKLEKKVRNIAGLQLADLIAYASKNAILLEEGLIPDPGPVFWREIEESLRPKYNRRFDTSQIQGYGKIFLR